MYSLKRGAKEAIQATGVADFHEALAGGLISLKIFFSFFSLISFVRGSIRSLTPTDGSAIKRALATSMLV